jgi:hypothetical protein
MYGEDVPREKGNVFSARKPKSTVAVKKKREES